MSTSSIPSSPQLFQDFLGKFHSRKLLLHNPFNTSPVPIPAAAAAHTHPSSSESSFDKNVLIVLSVLVCTIICTLILNFVIRCAFSSIKSLLISSPDSSNDTSPAKPIKKGIEKKTLEKFLIIEYSFDDDDQSKASGLDTECAICLSEFAIREPVRILPKCNHGFHVRCIDKWLGSNSTCPKCRHCLIEPCNATSTPARPVLETVIRIVPPEPVGAVSN